MTLTPLMSLLILLPLSLSPFSAFAQNTGTVSAGSSLSTGDTPWLSPSAEFAFGFQPINTTVGTGFLLAIWYNKLPDRTIVWYANRDSLAPPGSKVALTNDGLVLTTPRRAPLWTSQMNTGEQASDGFMNDTGNFVIRSRDSKLLWETFGEPTDTLLPTQTMPTGTVLYARRAETNFSKGRFKLAFQDDGNLVLYLQNLETYTQYGAYYSSGTADSANSSNSGIRWIFNSTGYMYILKISGEKFALTTGRVNPAAGYYHRATLNFDGVFTQYYHPRNVSSSGDGEGWKPEWTKPDNICSSFGLNERGSGACGFNSICSLTDDRRPRCECPPEFRTADKNDAYGNCEPNFVLGCAQDGPRPRSELYDFTELPNTNWPQLDYEELQPLNEEQCRDSCLDDCLCAVVVFGGDACWKKRLPLSNGVRGNTARGKALIKVRKDGSPPLSPIPSNFRPVDSAKKGSKGTFVVAGSVILGTSLGMVAGCTGFYLVYRRKVVKNNPGTADPGNFDANLRCFPYEELAEATGGFTEELGRGSFGIVYKGVLKLGASDAVTIAVKKLDRGGGDPEKEFKTEVQAIAKTNHRNLVRLFGFCDQGPFRLLVYEFMSNGTLARHLFGETRPCWNWRTEIARGIARGLLYLHEECSVPIIHCDIKPHNILLDEHHTARISDFGLAKLLRMNQSHTQTTMIRGTHGYAAPEWFRRNPAVTPKVDVYSFGVLLLEIVCCHGVSEKEIGGVQDGVLTVWADDCYRERRLGDFVGKDAEAMNELGAVERYVKTALWCVLEDPALRPTMRRVALMLEGVVEVGAPPFPSLSCAR